jgi:glucoamylase
MSHEQLAPGKPGVAPNWCASDKDLVITTLGPSRIWATVGHGVVNEVFWPSTGWPEIRELDFIVAKEDRWWDIKHLGNYELSTPRAYVPLPAIRHQGDGFALTLHVTCDDLRDVVLVRFTLEGDGHRLYALVAPRLGAEGETNSAWTERGAFYAKGDGAFLCLRSDAGFERQSIGYAGQSDGWEDFRQNGRMTWSYARAEDGNVAMIGELGAEQGTVAISFGASRYGVETLSRASLAEGFHSVRTRVEKKWEEWGANWDPPPQLDNRFRDCVEHSVAVLKSCEDRLFQGAVVASLSIPWGNERRDSGAYHFVWARDSVESALGMVAVEHYREARQLVAYLIATQQEDGHWTQNFYPSGEPHWPAVQLDQTSFPLLLVAKLQELGELGECHVNDMARRAIAFLLRAGPVTPQDRWEENEGISVFTLSLIVAALVGGADCLADKDEREYVLSYADYLNRRIEDWVHVENTDFARRHKVAGHYIRIASPQIFAGTHGKVRVANRANVWVNAGDMVALDFLYLARLGLRAADDPRILDTLKVVEGELRVETPSGPSFYRYNGDGYGEHEDGSAYNGTGIGRLWPLLTGERAHLAIQLGEDVNDYLDAMQRMTGPGGLLPEQIWDTAPIPEKGLHPGKPTGSAMPLLWAHAEFVKLATASITKQPIELLEAVRQRYHFERPEPDTWHWRPNAPFNELPLETDLLVEASEPFLLHYGFDGWRNIKDSHAQPLGLGMHGVRLAWNELQPHQKIDLTLFYDARGEWAQRDDAIRFGIPAEKTKQSGSARTGRRSSQLATAPQP